MADLTRVHQRDVQSIEPKFERSTYVCPYSINRGGSSDDPAINSLIDFAKNRFGDTQMFGLIARRPELLKRVASMFAYFPAGQGGLIEPRLLELMRVRGAHLNACTYCSTVRFQPVAEEVRVKEAALGVCDISGMTKSQAMQALRDKFRKGEFTPREAAAISLVDSIIVDPHSVDDALFAELRKHFSDEEIIELVCASSLFTWAGTLNTGVTSIPIATESLGRIYLTRLRPFLQQRKIRK
jgi:alkylhydroperoxidase family enzyme